MQYSVSNILYIFFICVDSKSVLYALKNWDCKMRGDILYEVKYLIHCIMYRGIGVEFCLGLTFVSLLCGNTYRDNNHRYKHKGHGSLSPYILVKAQRQLAERDTWPRP